MPKPPILPILDWEELFQKGIPYEEWIQTGESESNRRAMKDLHSKLEAQQSAVSAVENLPRTVHVLAIAEDWCPDVIRHVPVLMKLVEASDQIQVRFVERETAPDALVRYLTLGGEAIPKFIFLSDKFVECGSWGPMSNSCREFIARGKACGDMKTARQKVFQHYQADPQCREVFDELAHLFEIAGCEAP